MSVERPVRGCRRPTRVRDIPTRRTVIKSTLSRSAERIAQRATGIAAATTRATASAVDSASDALSWARDESDSGDRHRMVWTTAGVVALTGIALAARVLRRRRHDDDVVIDMTDPHVKRFETVDDLESGYSSTGDVGGWHVPDDELTERRN